MRISMVPLAWKFSNPSPNPSWKTMTSTPYAAPTDNRFNMIALIGMTGWLPLAFWISAFAGMTGMDSNPASPPGLSRTFAP